MDIELDIPGTGHGRLRFAGGWPGVEDLVNIAHGLAQSTWRCPDCADVPVEEFLLAIAKAPPAELAANLRERAGAGPEPGPATRALAASYERYASELAAIEVARSARSGT